MRKRMGIFSTTTSCPSVSPWHPLDGTCLPPSQKVQDDQSSATYRSISAGISTLWSSFRWKNELFVSASTMLYTLLFLFVIYFWWANRQFHFKKRQKDGSKLSSIATSQDAVQLQHLKQQEEQEDDSTQNADQDDITSDISDGQDEEHPVYLMDLEDADLSDYESDEDERSPATETKPTAPNHDAFFASLPPHKRKIVKDLTAVVSNMEVFSYLSSEAFVQCLEYMEYIDIKEGQELFSEQTLDGSLYAVISGKVKCHFEFQQHHMPQQQQQQQQYIQQQQPTPQAFSGYYYDEEDEDDVGPLISFIAGDGDIVTSLLTIVLGLVRKCHERSTPIGKEADGEAPTLPIVPSGISVRAVGYAPDTKVVRVPPQCFVAMLDNFPKDVHRISQTIVARMQRVTLQTIVRCLGLHREIVQRNAHESTVFSLHQMANHPEAWGRLKASLAKYVESGVSQPQPQPQPQSYQVELDAARVAAANIMGGHQIDTPVMERIQNKLQQVASIVTCYPGETLMEMGEAPNAIYMILHGKLDVGMNLPGASPLLKQSTRRANKMRPPPESYAAAARRKIIPKQASVKEQQQHKKQRNKHAAAHQQGAASTSTTTISSAKNSAAFSRVYQALVGETVGRLSCFTGDVSIVTVRNSSEWEPSIVYKIPSDVYNEIVAEHPTALTQCLDAILGRLVSPIVCLLDWNVEWMHVQAGEDIVHKGDSADSMFAVLNGRLRSTPLVNAATSNTQRNSSGGKSGSNVPPIPTQVPLERESSIETTSFLRRRLLERRRNKLKNLPKVSNSPPPPSRRMMNNNSEDNMGEEYGRGSIIGEVEILTGDDWSYDVYASRHSELARVPVSVLNAIIRMCPRAGLHLAKVVASQVKKKGARRNGIAMGFPPPAVKVADSPTKQMPQQGSLPSRNILPSYGLSLATIAVIPLLEGDFDLNGFCQTLRSTLDNNIAPTKLMTKQYAREQLGEEVWTNRNAMHSLKMTRLLGDMEESYRLVVYQADEKYTWWTRLCIQQADCILLVVRAEKAPPQKKTEKCLSWAFQFLNVKIQLVVLQSHSEDYNQDEDLDDAIMTQAMESSDQLNDWSEQRYWIAGHHLVRMPFRKYVLDFTRLCRRVTGRSIGIVLGGGGARGLAHIGVIQALNEAGLTIDFVGGTSQGAYIGALYATNPDDFKALVKAARVMADSMSSVKEKLFDLTLPLVSFFTGYRFNRGIQKALGTRRIQDLILNYYCVSTDIRNNVQVVHTKGVAWRYVRASMTLQSYLPPLSEEGSLLVDGGYMNVLPADIMKRQMGARTVIAVDVSQEVILDNYEYGSHLNGWWLLWNSWNPFVKTVKIPSMGDISERLAWVSADRHKKTVREHIDLFLQPPVGNYGVLEYDKFDDIVRLGYEYAKPRVDNFVKKNPHLVS